MTYKEQLADPRWQRRRLTRLEKSGWVCDDCGDNEKQLHVHHPRYFKGRKAWEYSDDELEVLCVDCHKNHHEFDAAVMDAAHASVYGADFAKGIMAGFLEAGMDLDVKAIDYACPDAVLAGRVAYMFFHANRVIKQKIANVLANSSEVRNPVEAETIDIYGGYEDPL